MSEYSMPSYFQNMPVIGKDLSAFHEDNAAEIQAVEQEIHEIREAALEAGKSTEALNESGQWTAMQRIMELVDEGTWCPLNSLYNPQKAALEISPRRIFLRCDGRTEVRRRLLFAWRTERRHLFRG